MNLNPFKLFKKSAKGYIALLLRETDGIIMYLEMNYEIQSLERIDSEKFTLTSRWDHLADDVDDALYKLEVRTKKTFDDIIFFVYSHLVEPNTHELKRQNLSSIKNLVKSMELKPLGFIEVHEALLQFLPNEDRRSLSAIVVESDATILTIFTYQGGKLISQRTAQRKKSFLSDLTETLLAQKDEGYLPSRIIFLPSKDAQEGADLVKHNWDEKLFVHQPTVLLVSEEDVINSLISTFSAQIMDDGANDSIAKPASEQYRPKVEEKGYVDQPDEVLNSKPDKMGFVIGGEPTEETDIVDRSEILRPAFASAVTKGINSFLNYFKSVVQKISMLRIFQSRKALIHSSIIIGSVLIVAGFILLEFSFHKATISILLPSQKLELARTFDARILGLKEATTSAKFETRNTTTGVKNIGEPAKGTVTIYNSSLTESKTFAKGTTIIGPSNLSFKLDAEVKVASASGDAIDIISSSAKSSVTASSIGPESNLAAGTKFTVGDESNSNVVAKNDSSFVGGTKTQIQIVSEKDIANAETKIDNLAQDYLKKNIAKSIGTDAVLLKPLTIIKILTEDLDNQLGEEASSVTLKAEVSLSYSYLSSSKLRKVIADSLRSKIQKNLTISERDIKYKVLTVKDIKGDVQVEVKSTARAVSPVTEAEILKSISGKSIDAMQTLAKEKYQAQGMEFTITHPIKLFQSILPLFPNNIKLSLLYP